MSTLENTAKKALSYFRYTGDGDDSHRPGIWVKTEDAPEWVGEMVHDAHGDMLPDDYRYAFIVNALEAVAEHGDDDDALWEAIDGAVAIYTAERYAWLSSNLSRQGYVDEAVAEMGHSEQGIVGDIAMGEFAERQEVLGSVLASLREQADLDTTEATV